MKKLFGWDEKFGLARCAAELEDALEDQRDEIPDAVFARGQCIVSIRVFKTGIGVLSQAIGYGCLVMRLPAGTDLPPESSSAAPRQEREQHADNPSAASVDSAAAKGSTWSPPVAIKVIGLSAGVALGYRHSRMLVIFNSDGPGRDLMSGRSLSLGTDFSIVSGPRSEDGVMRHAHELRFSPTAFTYDRSDGAYLGIGLQGCIIRNRPEENRIFYEDQSVSPENILRGQISPPPSARPLLSLLASLPTIHSPDLGTVDDTPKRDLLHYRINDHHHHQQQRRRQEPRPPRQRPLDDVGGHAMRRAPSTLISFLRVNSFWRFFALIIVGLMALRLLGDLLVGAFGAVLSALASG